MKTKLAKRWLLKTFVKHRYWLNQGNNAFASVSAIPIEKVAVVMAAGKYLLGDHVDNWVLYGVFGLYCVWRFVSRWAVGWFWHRNNGYDIETEWNKGKIPPSRTEIINLDEIADAVARRLRDA